MQEDKRVSYGPWEKRDDLPPLKHEVRDYRTGLIREELRPVIDRKVSTTWIEDGQMMGRWVWESGL